MQNKDPKGSRKKKKIKLATNIVPRDIEWKLLSTQLDARRDAGRTDQSIINFIGTFGIGKTTLLQATLQDRLRADYPDIPFSFIDFNSSNAAESYRDPETRSVRLLEQLINPIQIQCQLPADKFIRARREFDVYLRRAKLGVIHDESDIPPSHPDVENELEIYQTRLVDAFVEYIQEVVTQKIQQSIVLLIDSLDDAPEPLFTWLEKSVLDPLTSLGKVICVLASRQEVGWQLFDTRKRVQVRRLEPFDKGTTITQVGEGLAGLADEIYQLTFGLPGATRLMMEEIVHIERRDKISFDQSIFQQYQTHLIQHCLQEQLLDEYIFRRVSVGLREMLFVLSPLRYFTVNIAASIFPQMMTYFSYQVRSNGIDTLGIIRDFIDTTLVSWDREKQGYIIDDAIQQIMVLILRTQRPAILLEIHREAARIYGQLISLTSPVKRGKYVVEWIYHTVHVLSQGDDPELIQVISSSIRLIVEQSYYNKTNIDRSSVDKLYKLVEDDADLKRAFDSIHPRVFDNVLVSIKACTDADQDDTRGE